MNLTQSYPASVRQELFGIVQLQRTIDKGKAKAHGDIGEYHYNCPMDKHVFEFLGMDHEALLDVIGKNDEKALNDFVKSHVEKKSAAELQAFNKAALEAKPAPGSDSEKYFFELRNEVAPDRKDVTAWADLLDLDEKRSVPQRVAA